VGPEPDAQAERVAAYLDLYRAEIARHVSRYCYRLRKLERERGE
jgi:hypothetical protein